VFRALGSITLFTIKSIFFGNQFASTRANKVQNEAFNNGIQT